MPDDNKNPNLGRSSSNKTLGYANSLRKKEETQNVRTIEATVQEYGEGNYSKIKGSFQLYDIKEGQYGNEKFHRMQSMMKGRQNDKTKNNQKANRTRASVVDFYDTLKMGSWNDNQNSSATDSKNSKKNSKKTTQI